MLRHSVLTFVRKIWLFAFVIACLSALVLILTDETLQIDIPAVTSPLALIGAVAAQLIFWLVATLMWNITTSTVSGSQLTLPTSFEQLAIVSVGKYLPGKIGGILARGSRMAHHGIPIQKAAIATLYEQVILLHAALIASAAIYVAHKPSIIGVFAAALAFTGVVFAKWFFTVLLATVCWFLLKLGKPVSSFSPVLIPHSRYATLTLGYVVVWILSGSILNLLYMSFFTVDFTLSIFALMIFANTVGITAGFFAIFAPGGIGVREGVAAAILATQIPFADAAILVVLFRIWTVASDFLAGLSIVFSGPSVPQPKQ